MYKKKSQVSIFIIFGIILLIIVASYFFLRTKDEEITPEDQYSLLNEKSVIVRNYVENCLQKELENAIEFVSLQGGFVYRPELGLERDNYNIAYDYYLGVNLLPNFDEVENDEIEIYLDQMVPQCLEKTGILDEQYITFGYIDSEIDIKEKYVHASLDYPVTLTSGSQETKLNDFSVQSDVNLGTMLEIAHDIIEHTVDDPNWIDVGFLESLGKDIEVIHIDEKTIVYKINDPEVKFKGGDYSFMFSALFTDNSPPDLFRFSDYSINVGDTLEVQPYALDFDNDDLSYSADSRLINIDPITGLITFTPLSPGMYEFNINVDDGDGLSDQEILKVNVV